MAKAKQSATTYDAGAAPTQIIYLGHTITERVSATDRTIVFSIGYGKIYLNGLPDDVKERCKADPDFALLFVPVEKAARIMRDLANPASPMAAAKERVLKKSYKLGV